MYIAIAGNIGSGKTTLTEILTERYGAKAYYEDLANPYISDFYEDAHIFADNLHSMGLMASRDFDTYMKMFNIEQSLLPRPDVLIYLKASVPTLIAQIKMRGRDYEQNIDEEYLNRLNDKYNNWIENIYEGRVLVVDKDVDDFVADPSIIDRICASVEEMCTGKRQL